MAGNTISKYPDNRVYSSVTIEAAGTESGVMDLGGTTLIGLLIPASFEGTQIKIEGAIDESGVVGTFFTLANVAGDIPLIQVQAERFLFYTASDLVAIRYIKIIAQTTQASEREIKVISRPLV
jgi:hypothetical protein